MTFRAKIKKYMLKKKNENLKIKELQNKVVKKNVLKTWRSPQKHFECPK